MLKTKLNKKLNKILAFIFLILILFNTAQPVFASSGSGTFVAGQFASYMFTTDNSNTANGVIIRKITNINTNETKTVFCSEHGLDMKTGAKYNGSYYIPTDGRIREACKIAYFGWYSKYGDYIVDSGIPANVKKDYVFTQQYVWEALGQSNASFIDPNIQNEYIAYKNEINGKINSIRTKPSFSDTTITVDAGTTTTLTDTHGVLKDYSSIDTTVNGVRFVHNAGDNSMTITVNNDCMIEDFRISDEMMKNWGLVKDSTRDNGTTIYFSFPDDGVQDQFYALHYNDPLTMAMHLKINLLGNLEINKFNTEKNLIDGSTFRVTGPNNFNQLVTVSNGKITLEKIRRGTYTIKEEKAPFGYVLNTEEYKAEVRPNETKTQAVINTEPTGKIAIIKQDSETGTTPQGDATFKGAKYEVYANEDIYNVAKTKKYYSKGDLIATRIMNEKGTTEDVIDLPLGKYIVKEIESSEGYLLDTKVYEVNLEYKDQYTKVISNTTTSYEVVKKMQVHIFKSGIKEQSGELKGLEGAEFTIKLNSDVEKAYQKGYSYIEIWNGIDEKGNIVEVDKNRVAEAQKIAPSYEIITTDKDGNAYTNQKLPYGKYFVKETKTPKDFETAEDFTFSITQDESEIKEIALKVKDIIVNNEQLETYIKLIKKDKETGKVVTLNSATFEIKAAEDIYDRGNGKIIYKKGEMITQKIGSTTYSAFTTNADNIVVPDNSYNSEKDEIGTITTPLMLEVGSYEINEINTPKGFLQLDNPIHFKIDGIRDYDKDNDGDFIKEVLITNEKPTGTLNINKNVILRDDIDTSIIDISDLSGIQFSLIAKEDIIDFADGSTIYKKGQEIGKYNLDKNGNLKVEKIPMGTYDLQEIKTINGLVLNDTKYEIKFVQVDLVTKVYEVEQNISNDTTVFEFSKTDITGEKELVGAKLTVIDENNEIIDTWVSTEKTHKIEGLIVGKTYTLREEISPDGFVKSTDIKFKVKNSKEIQKVTMIDKVLEIVKTDVATGEELEGAEMKVTDLEGNVIDTWISTKEPHKVTGLEEGKTYKLIEITAPYGYEIAEEIKFTVTTDKETQKIEMKDMPILKDVKILKIDSKTKEVIKDKFTFGIYEDQECTKLIREIESDKKDGFIIFEDLRYGTYFVKEHKAPKGYVLSNEIVKIEINDIGVSINENLTEKEDNIYSYKFENMPIEVPNTGDDRNIIFYILTFIFSALGITTISVFEYKRKKNK